MTEEAEEKHATPFQRTYGRGVFDGLKLAGVTNPGEVMNNARMRAIENGLNGLAKKVYAIIPVDQPVSVSDIIRLCAEKGSKIDHRVGQGCIATLIDKGLVRGAERDTFQRVPPKPVIVRPGKDEPSDPADAATPAPADDQAAKDASPLERLAALEGKVRTVSTELTALAHELGNVAVDVEEFVERVKTDNAKVAQLKELLKSL